ncbi:MAG: rhamnogalacturonan lyase family protein [Thermoguttaceae bacterium]
MVRTWSVVVCFVWAVWIPARAFCAAGAGAKVEGYAPQRVEERLDRGLVAIRIAQGEVYLSWRLLRADGPQTAFNVYRHADDAKPVRINSEPIRRTTDLVDRSAPQAGRLAYSVRPITGGLEGEASPAVALSVTDPGKPYLAIRLQGDYSFQKVGIADLDGDGRLDYVIKQPNANIDPYEKYWSRSPETYKLEAYLHDGRFLWRYDLGWAIERGIWYSPYVVYDLDGDGKAEVAAKTGQGDPRDPDGRVQSGPEHLSILDGLTGELRTRVDWPSRKDFTGPGAYNYASRNQLCVAYLDGKTPCLIVQRGTYGFMTAVAYQFHGGKLRQLWRWDNRNLGRDWLGQGAHWMHAADVDGDGRDEVLLGSSVLDDDGRPLWSTGLGHPDHFYVGDLDPSRPGLEIYYGIERRSPRNGMCMVDARTGRILWGHDEPTIHIHSSGLCSDIDPTHPGAECYSGERDFKDKRWLRNCKGEVLATEDLGGLAPRAVYWDADPHRELLVGSKVFKYRGPTLAPRIEGSLVAVADLLGDWREEILTSLSGQLRIYTTTIPATDRRVCLMQDPIYRMDVVCAAMGYYQVPMTSYDLAGKGPAGR